MKIELLKINQFLLFWVLLTVVLYFGKVVLIPVTFAIMLAMLMAPVCRWLDGRKFHRIISALICIIILLVIFLLIAWILAKQIISFSQQVPLFEHKITAFIDSFTQYMEKQFNIPATQQHEAAERTQLFGEKFITYARNFLGSMTTLFAGFAITLAVTFLFLIHKERYEKFFLMLGKKDNHDERQHMLNDITKVAQQYLTGRAISILILFVLYTVALLVIGIKNALLLSAIAALVNIIPYIGPLLAGVFPVMVALVNYDTLNPAIWVIITFSVIQGIDNYFVTPMVLGGEVNLSALSTILIIICGGFVWGIAGMILFIPLLSIVKIVFDHVPSLKPFGYLIGDPSNTKPTEAFKDWFKKIFK